MVVVADTSPVNYLILLGKVELLETLYGRMLIPHAVHEEMLSAKVPATVRAWAENPPEWLNIISPTMVPNHGAWSDPTA